MAGSCKEVPSESGGGEDVLGNFERFGHPRHLSVGAGIELDFDEEVERLDAGVLDRLLVGGYLSSIPDDPGFADSPDLHYVRTPEGNGVACLMHGTPPDHRGSARGTPREQLEAAGVTDPDLLARAAFSTRDPRHPMSGHRFTGALHLALRDTLTALAPFSALPWRVLARIFLGR